MVMRPTPARTIISAGIGAHAAQPDDQYVGLSEQVEFLLAVQQLGAFKPLSVFIFNCCVRFIGPGAAAFPAALSCLAAPVVNIRP